ncbi:MAG TPA: hypothetical protein VGP80_05965 [Gemmatimonadales bacterium]|jgi:uncharacterized protein (UPF0333 family)|nr:hypothetical protein [Gemmatimonadales bacterium]
MRTISNRNERGIALPLVLFVMVILGLVIAGTFYVARLEMKSGDNTIAAAQASGAAEAGIDSVLAGWNSTVYNAMASSAETTMATISLGGNSSYIPVLRRLNNTLFMVRAEGREAFPGGGVQARRYVAQLVRLDIPQLAMNSAITTRTGITISGSSDVSGVDSVPAPWGGVCPPPGPNHPGVTDSSGNVITSGACSGASCITGTPQILTDPTVNSSTFTQYGNTNFYALAARANLTVSGTMNGIGPSVTGSPAVCQTSFIDNWGDPMNPNAPCGNYWPIIYAPGDLTVNGGVGQGLLLVAGDLTMAGGMEFYGPVISLGTVRSVGTGGHIYGGMMASNANLGTVLISGNSVVNFSSCAIARALQGISIATPLGERSWAQLN